jgi:thiol-disulfide isomerase/thioredoxin
MIAIFGCTVMASAQEVKRIKITDLEEMMRDSTRPMIVNMWATWCKPCIEEIPYFLEALNDHKKDSLRLILVSLDGKELYPDALNKFVLKRNYHQAEVYWLDETNADYFCPRFDNAWSGAIPATLFINNRTGHRRFFEVQVEHGELKKEIKHLLRAAR